MTDANAAACQEASTAGLDAGQRLDRTVRSLLTASNSPVSADEGLPKLQKAIHSLNLATR
jgi:hypothetical protein